MSVRALRGVLGAIAAMLICASAIAQQYPSRPVRLIVPFSPGGGTDLVSRITANKLSEMLGQQFVVDNRPGAGTIVGSELAARAAGDGHTLIMQVNSLAANHTLYPKKSYDTHKDFIPVVLVGSTPNVLVMHPSIPANDVKEFVALAQKRPDSISYASSGVGGASFLAAEYFKMLTGVRMLHVPYKGTGPAMRGILGGEAQTMIAAAPGTISFIKGGQLKALGVTGPKRWPVMPQLPTLAEAGIIGFEFETWYGLFVPGGTPPAIVGKLNASVNSMLAMPDVKAQLERAGVQPAGGTQQGFSAYFQNEIDKLGKVIRTTGAKP